MEAYIYLVRTSKVQERSNLVGDSASAVDLQQVFKSMLNALVNEECSITVDIDKYQSVLYEALSKVYFPIGTGIYIPPSNLNLNISNFFRIQL